MSTLSKDTYKTTEKSSVDITRDKRCWTIARAVRFTFIKNIFSDFTITHRLLLQVGRYRFAACYTMSVCPRSGQIYFKCSTLEPRLRFGCRKIRINVKMPTWLFDHKSVTNRIPSNKDHIFCNVPSSAQSYFEGWKVINIQVAKMLNHLTKTATICVMYSD